MRYLGAKNWKQLDKEFDSLYGHLDLENEDIKNKVWEHFFREQNMIEVIKALPDYYLKQEDKPAFIILINKSLSNYIVEYERRKADKYINQDLKEYFSCLIEWFNNMKDHINIFHEQQIHLQTVSFNGGYENEVKKGEVVLEPVPAQIEATDEIFNVQKAAEFLSLSIQTIYTLNSQQKIPSHKQGKLLYFSKNELTSWVKKGRSKTLKEIEMEAEAYVQQNRFRT